jgi:hypothetical protein
MNNQYLLAQITNPLLPTTIGSGATDAGATALGKLIGNVAGGILVIGFLLAFFYLLTGAMSWITASGDKNQLEAARNKITHAIIGLIILASVWAIMTLVSAFLGISFPNIPIPTLDSVINGGGGGAAPGVNTAGSLRPT